MLFKVVLFVFNPFSIIKEDVIRIIILCEICLNMGQWFRTGLHFFYLIITHVASRTDYNIEGL